MKKNIQYILATAFLALILPCLTSCGSEAEEESGMARARFSGELPSDLQSRAYGDASQIDSLIVGIFNEQKVETGRYSFPVSGSSFDIDLALMKGHTYNLVFWAQSSRCGTYDTSDLKHIKMECDTLPLTLGEAECKDAFVYVWKDFHMDRDMTQRRLTLYRPVAQVNAGRVSGASAAALTLRGLPDTFNTFEGTASGEKDFTWTFPNPEVEQTMEVEGNVYKRIALAYVFAPGTEMTAAGSLVLTETKIEIGGVVDIVETFPLTDVKLQQNKRTNIVGNFPITPGHINP